jgi:ribosomal protein S18 acetylase RimI-like enzyme
MPEPEAQIRHATTADAPALARLSAALFPLGCPANTKPEDLAEYIRQELTPQRFCALLEDDRNVILVVNIADKLAGYALLAHGSKPPYRQLAGCELRKFYIDAAYHGRGVANALMRKVLAIAEDGGEGTLWLSVFSGNERAISFYRKWGFRIAGVRDFLVGTDCQQDYLMQHEVAINANEDADGKKRLGNSLSGRVD